MKRKKLKNLDEKAYTFSIQPVHSKKKSMKKSINVRGSMILSELDHEVRNAMGYDTWDHLSGFYQGKPGRSNEIATICPDGTGENTTITIDELNLSKGTVIGHVYDFGDNIQSVLTVEEVVPYHIRF